MQIKDGYFFAATQKCDIMQHFLHVCVGSAACLHRTAHLMQLPCARQVSNVQARAARLSWAPPAGLVNRHSNGMPVSCSFEVSLSDKGRDGKYRLIYR